MFERVASPSSREHRGVAQASKYQDVERAGSAMARLVDVKTEAMVSMH